jgi:hypothetical protein
MLTSPIALLLLAGCGGVPDASDDIGQEDAPGNEETASSSQPLPFLDFPCAVPEVMPETGAVGDLRPRHDIKGYLNGSSAVANEYLLEEGVTLRATQAPCMPTPVPAGYFVKATVQFAVLTPGGQVTTLFTGKPMGTETTLPLGDFRELEVTVHHQICTNGASGPSCQSPLVKAKRKYKIEVQPRSTFCTVEFSRTEFELEDTNLAGTQTANVTNVQHGHLNGLSNHGFRALGVSTAAAPVQNEQAQKPFIPIVGTGVFGVHSWEPCLGQTVNATSGCSLPQYSALGSSDTFRPHALRFARVEGTNTISKLPYSYTCTQPAIVRDRIAECSGGMPDTYYRLPFLSNQQVEVSQGNCGDTTHACGGGQQFALDFRADKGTPVLAARGGVVVGILDGVTGHCSSAEECDALGIPASGNYVQIQHQDNTIAVYAHLTPDSMAVSLGQTIKRGTLLAMSGFTGRASGPHLHFHVREAVSIAGGVTIPASYQYYINEPLDAVNLKSCRIPAEDGDHWSNNTWVIP